LYGAVLDEKERKWILLKKEKEKSNIKKKKKVP